MEPIELLNCVTIHVETLHIQKSNLRQVYLPSHLAYGLYLVCPGCGVKSMIQLMEKPLPGILMEE